MEMTLQSQGCERVMLTMGELTGEGVGRQGCVLLSWLLLMVRQVNMMLVFKLMDLRSVRCLNMHCKSDSALVAGALRRLHKASSDVAAFLLCSGQLWRGRMVDISREREKQRANHLPRPNTRLSHLRN